MIHNRPSPGAVQEMLGADYTHDVDGPYPAVISNEPSSV